MLIITYWNIVLNNERPWRSCMVDLTDRSPSYYKSEIHRSEKAWEVFYVRANEVIREYRNLVNDQGDRSSIAQVAQPHGRAYSGRYNLLYSITSTLVPWMVDKSPRPDFRRRFWNEEPVAAEAATVMQRACEYFGDIY